MNSAIAQNEVVDLTGDTSDNESEAMKSRKVSTGWSSSLSLF
jgi:hypothetical protein